MKKRHKHGIVFILGLIGIIFFFGKYGKQIGGSDIIEYQWSFYGLNSNVQLDEEIDFKPELNGKIKLIKDYTNEGDYLKLYNINDSVRLVVWKLYQLDKINLEELTCHPKRLGRNIKKFARWYYGCQLRENSRIDYRFTKRNMESRIDLNVSSINQSLCEVSNPRKVAYRINCGVWGLADKDDHSQIIFDAAERSGDVSFAIIKKESGVFIAYCYPFISNDYVSILDVLEE